MPIYEYECLKCGKGHEIMQRHNELPLTKCPDCGGEVKKLISNSSFVLKGTGWYKTDYPSPQSDKPAKADTSSESPAKSEKKPETKPETAAKT
ncbi:MAG: FmdB family zinc ribbon protein [Thermodesulfovibrionales bacterium]